MTRSRSIAAGAVAAAVALAVAFSISGGEEGRSTATVTGVTGVETELSGVPQRDNVLGQPAAPVEIIEYGDLACPACRLASETLVPRIVAEFVRDGQVRLAFRPIAFISPSSERGARAAEAAADQDAMWSMVELLYLNQGDEREGWLTEELAEQAAMGLGLDLGAWRRAYRSRAVERRHAAREAAARADGVRVAPTFIVRGPRGRRVLEGAVEIGVIRETIQAVGPA